MSKTVADVLSLVLREKSSGSAAGTVDMYKRKILRLNEVLGADRPVDTISADTVDEYIAKRREAGVSSHTIQKELIVLRQAIRHARRKLWTVVNVDDVMPVRFSAEYSPRKEFLPQDKWEDLLTQFRPERAAQLAFMIATGANLGESTRARRSHINLSEGQVWIDGTKRETRQRWVPISTVSRPLIERVLRDAPGKDILFDTWSQIWRDLADGSRRAGLPHLSTNDLRRTYGSILVQSGVPFEVVAKLMGHTDTSMVYRVYGQLRPQHLKSIVDKYVL